jgi:hypothetical protein
LVRHGSDGCRGFWLVNDANIMIRVRGF